MRAHRCLFNTSPAIWSVILEYAADTCAQDQQHYTIETICATSVANSASFVVRLSDFSDPFSYSFSKKSTSDFLGKPYPFSETRRYCLTTASSFLPAMRTPLSVSSLFSEWHIQLKF